VIHRDTRTENHPTVVVLREWQTCDMCGTEIIEKDYEVKEGRVFLKLGENWPEGGSGTKIRADLCTECFMKRLVPWLESQGVKMQTEGWEW
jgi:hypothetical protein